MGHSRISTMGRYIWFITILWLLLKSYGFIFYTAEVKYFSCFHRFHKMIKDQFDINIKILRTDNGREYMDAKFQDFIAENEFTSQTSCFEYISANWNC